MISDNNDKLAGIAEPLLVWFSENARILPWRDEPTPYRVWISEIMLQQTRVEAVKPYYERFLQALPDIKSLAEVEEDRLMKLWEGLGYYNRARNLKKAAQIMSDQYDGKMPGTYEEILSLPGIGSYTAGAISSIALGMPKPAVDGNVLRVWARLYRREEDILKQSVKRMVEESFEKVIPADAPGAFNQALMELGATVCTPNGIPKCEVCPLKGQCEGFASKAMMEYPKKAPGKARRIERRTILIIRCGEDTLIGKRPDKGLLAGLYELPSADGMLDEDAVLAYVRSLQLKPLHLKALCEAKHIFSHVEWHMKGYAIRVDELEVPESKSLGSGRYRFIDPKRIQSDYPIPSAFSAYTEYMDIRLGRNSIGK